MPERIEEKNSSENYALLDIFIDDQLQSEDSLISVLHKGQEIFGYLPQELQLHIARKLNLPAAKVYGVVSFYSYFSQTKRGEHTISVCLGTACFVKGIDKVMDAFKEELGINCGETTADDLFTIREVRCIGACGLAPVVMIDDKVFGHVSPEDVKNIIDQYKPLKEA